MVHPLPPRLYGRLIATPATREMIEKSHQQMVDVFDSTRLSSRSPPPPVTDFSEYLHLSASNSLSKNSASQLRESSAAEEKIASSDPVVDPTSSSSFDFPFCCERSWTSHSFRLPPGEYILLIATEEQRTVQSPSHPHSASSLHQSQNQNNPQTSYDPNQHKRRVRPKQISSVPTVTLFPENDGLQDGIWCQVSSIGRIGLHELPQSEVGEKLPSESGSYFHEMKAKSLPKPEVWPLMMDHQQEVSSKGLIQIMTQLRAEVNRINVDFLEIKSRETITKANRVIAPL
jgi:hypothetical protein